MRGWRLSDWAAVGTGESPNYWVLILIRYPKVVESFWAAKSIEHECADEEVVASRWKKNAQNLRTNPRADAA